MHIPCRYFEIHACRGFRPQVPRFCSTILASRERNPKVDKLRTSRRGQEDVTRLDISMCDLDVFAMKVTHAAEDLVDDRLRKDNELDLAGGGRCGSGSKGDDGMRREPRGLEELAERVRDIWHPKTEI